MEELESLQKQLSIIENEIADEKRAIQACEETIAELEGERRALLDRIEEEQRD